MSTRQLTVSDFAAHCVDELSVIEKGDTVVELLRDGKVIATISPIAPHGDGGLVELACHAYAAGRVSREVAASLANMTRAEFDQALFDHRIPSYDEARLAQDRQTLRSLRNR